jgi:glycosyltransferase involved in cell wall biosynthesis
MAERTFASVTVVIPCFRCAETITRAVSSVAAQTIPVVEVILVEDCSGDGTLDALYALQAQYQQGWIKVLSMPDNRGPGSARNVGWAAASQKYIAFLDADDAWHPNKIEIQYVWMEAHPSVPLTAHACHMSSISTLMASNEFCRDAPIFSAISVGQLLLSNRLPTRSVMLRRDLPQRFAEGKRQSEDYLLWCEIALNGHDCYRSELKLAYLFKPEFGEAGLSGNLWKMFIGELDTYKRLSDAGFLKRVTLYALFCWSIAKYFRRIAITSRRNLFKSSAAL